MAILKEINMGMLETRLKDQVREKKIQALIKRFRDALTDEKTVELAKQRKRGRNNIHLTFTTIKKEDY